MEKLDYYIVQSNSTIIQALEVINSNGKGIALVIDTDNKLLGTITDGDIRRAILAGNSVNDSIYNVYNTDCIYAVKDKISQQLVDEVRNKKVKFIPIVDNNKRIIDYVEIDELNINYAVIKPNPVLIMAGGLGTRLKPLTDEIPKPMLKVGDRPILETIINEFKKQGFTNILISVNYKSQVIEDYFRDGADFGVNINYIKEEKRMGTAGAIKLAEDFLNIPYFVVNGDILTKVNYNRLLDHHKENNFIMTIGCRNYEMQIPYGVLNIDDVCVTALEEKPIVSYYVSGGIYILNPETLKYIPKNEYFDITELINLLIKQKEIIGSFPIQDYWMDIGHINDYYQANEDIKKYF